MASKTPSSARTPQSRAKVIPAIPLSLNSKHKSSQPRSHAEPHPAVEIPPVSTQPEEEPSSPANTNQDKAEDAIADAQVVSVMNSGHGETVVDSTIDSEPSQTEQVAETSPPARQDQDGLTPAASLTKPNVPSQTPLRELPPAFVPRNPSVTSASAQQQDQRSNITGTHQPRISTTSLVFGGQQDSSSSSPAPPSAGGPILYTPQTPTGYPGPMAMQGPPPFIPGGHSYHMSEPNSGPFYPAPYVPNFQGYPRDYYGHPPPQFGQSRPFNPPNNRFNYQGRRQDDYAMAGRYHQPRMQQNMPPTAHGLGRPSEFPADQYRPSHSGNLPSPSPVVDGAPPPPPPQFNHAISRGNGSDTQGLPHRNSISAQKLEVEPGSSSENEYAPLAAYIHRHFNNREFSDYSVQLSHLGYLFPPSTLACHGVVLARSPKLRSLMTMQSGPQATYPKNLQIQISDKFVNNDVALTKAMMWLYGESLADEAFISTISPSSSTANHSGVARNEPMSFALAYAATGFFLQIHDIIARGLDLAARAIQWHNVEKALAFALEGGLAPSWNQGEAVAVEDRASTSSIDDTPRKLDSPTAAPTYGIYSDRLLGNVLQFLTSAWPEKFQFSSTAPQLTDVPRLPAIAEPKHSRSGSRLSHIRFGEMTLDEDEGKADPVSAKLSSILISLPFPLLKHITEHSGLGEKLGWAKVAEIGRNVVDERESRRQRGTNARSSNHTAESASEERLWHNVRWAESVIQDDQHPSGIKVSRRRTGVETPPSTGSAKS